MEDDIGRTHIIMGVCSNKREEKKGEPSWKVTLVEVT